MFIGKLRTPRRSPEFSPSFWAQSVYLGHACDAEHAGERVLRHFAAWPGKDTPLDDNARACFTGRRLQDR